MSAYGKIKANSRTATTSCLQFIVRIFVAYEWCFNYFVKRFVQLINEFEFRLLFANSPFNEMNIMIYIFCGTTARFSEIFMQMLSLIAVL